MYHSGKYSKPGGDLIWENRAYEFIIVSLFEEIVTKKRKEAESLPIHKISSHSLTFRKQVTKTLHNGEFVSMYL